MKRMFILSLLFISACTISDKYYKPYTDIDNVGTSAGTIETRKTISGNTYPVFSGYSDFCWYLFGVFKMSNKCSPDNIAHQNNLATITEINTQWQLFPFVTVQRTTIIGIPADDDKINQ